MPNLVHRFNFLLKVELQVRRTAGEFPIHDFPCNAKGKQERQRSKGTGRQKQMLNPSNSLLQMLQMLYIINLL